MKRHPKQGEHRPDLTGMAAKRMVVDHLKRTMYDICADPEYLLEVVGQGYHTFHVTTVRAFAPYPIDDQITRRMFRYFCDRVVATFGANADGNTDPYAVAKDVLNKLEKPSAPTQDEIDAAWQIEDMSSQAGQRWYHETVGEHPAEHLAKLIRKDRDDGVPIGMATPSKANGKASVH